MIMIDLKDTRPLYEQIVDRFATLILRGILPTDEKMPSVRSLAMELSINPNTIQRAYGELERRGFIYSVQGRGSFVAFSEQLMAAKREELRHRIKAIRREAGELSIPFAELLEGVDYD